VTYPATRPRMLQTRTPRSARLASMLALAGCSGVAANTNGAGGPPQVEASAQQFAAAIVTPDAAADRADANGAAWRVIEVPAIGDSRIVRTPDGWFALSRHLSGYGKVVGNAESTLYRSADGVRWSRIPLQGGDDDLNLRGLAYGGGRYVMVGTRHARGVVSSSKDGERWSEALQPVGDASDIWRNVVFAGSHFYGLGTRALGISGDGERWDVRVISTVQPEAVAFGDGRYVLVGSGPVQISEDGERWRENALDCALPGACISDPDGNVGQSYHSRAIFAEGRFFTEQLSSADGTHWVAAPDRSPVAYEGGYFLGDVSLAAGLEAWVKDGPIERLRLTRPARAAVTAEGRGLQSIGLLPEGARPDQVDVSFDDGLDCTRARCIILDRFLLLVPPPGAAPLPDRVPRDAAGAPLLSDECPVSNQIFCSDYVARSNCTCHADAPRVPRDCGDVGRYACAGAFTARPDEWPVSEVGAAGCSCDAVDPNQPPTFGLPCTATASQCQSPLACLPIAPPPSYGPPAEPPLICTSACNTDADCPSWQATGYCAGDVHLRCSDGTCQPRDCE
jgi:hypothetical protein